MPMKWDFDDNGEPVLRYDWPAKYVTPSADISDRLREWRKSSILDQEEFLRLKKQCGREDREGAQFFKQESRRFLRLQRACTLMIPWFGDPDKAQTVERPILWPAELVVELDEVANRIVLEFG